MIKPCNDKNLIKQSCAQVRVELLQESVPMQCSAGGVMMSKPS